MIQESGTGFRSDPLSGSLTAGGRARVSRQEDTHSLGAAADRFASPVKTQAEKRLEKPLGNSEQDPDSLLETPKLPAERLLENDSPAQRYHAFSGRLNESVVRTVMTASQTSSPTRFPRGVHSVLEGYLATTRSRVDASVTVFY